MHVEHFGQRGTPLSEEVLNPCAGAELTQEPIADRLLTIGRGRSNPDRGRLLPAGE